MAEKFGILKSYIASLGSVAVAFSGGVDSTFLLKTAHDVLGDKAIAVKILTSFTYKDENINAEKFCKTHKIKLITDYVNENEIENFVKNPPDRCYYCKKHIFTKILSIAKENNISNVIDGSNSDDLKDYRPGLKALEELGIKSPLRIADLNKSEIRSLSKNLKLKTWNKPSCACAATNIPYGEKITRKKLKMIQASRELMNELGFGQFRVRIHKNSARIEIPPKDFHKIIRDDIRTKIYDDFQKFGFDYVSLDLKGYRSGSMNETLK